jgi:hypothetical protein
MLISLDPVGFMLKGATHSEEQRSELHAKEEVERRILKSNDNEIFVFQANH